ncbi:MAG: hypothetical protein PHT69_17110 [Bacteroidales bacterium]|nr:hypothetical protein [Bacteroidales bacterium]
MKIYLIAGCSLPAGSHGFTLSKAMTNNENRHDIMPSCGGYFKKLSNFDFHRLLCHSQKGGFAENQRTLQRWDNDGFQLKRVFEAASYSFTLLLNFLLCYILSF